MSVAPQDGCDAPTSVPGALAPGSKAIENDDGKSDEPVTKEKIFLLARQGRFTKAPWQPSVQMAGTERKDDSTCWSLLERAPEFWQERDDDGHSLLHWAALQNDVEFSQACLKNNIEVDSRANNKQTPFHWAVLKGHLKCTKLFLEKGADIRAVDSMGASGVILAVQHFQRAMLLLLLKRCPEMINVPDSNGCSPVHWAAYKGDEKTLKLLAYLKADFQIIDTANMSPLHRAVSGGQPAQVCEILIENRVDVNLRCKSGDTALDIAEKKGNGPMQAYLKKAIAKNAKNSAEDDLEAMIKDETSPSRKKGGALKGMYQDASKDKTLQRIFPMFWIVCVSLSMFQYLTSVRPICWAVAPRATLIFELAVPAMLAIFISVCVVDPGTMPTRPQGNSAVEEIMEWLSTSAPEPGPNGMTPDMNRLCMTTWNLKGLRTKYCTMTKACVEEFDHYCVWVNNAIGKGNHRLFIVLAAWEASVQYLHLYILFQVVGEKVSWTGIMSSVWTTITVFPLMSLLMLAHFMTAPWVTMLLAHQLRLVATNLTTNEMMNMGRESYQHFWEPMGGGNRMRNPFNKGDTMKNCLDFWWIRTRGEFGPGASPSNCGGGHGHSHGGHGHSHGAKTVSLWHGHGQVPHNHGAHAHGGRYY